MAELAAKSQKLDVEKQRREAVQEQLEAEKRRLETRMQHLEVKKQKERLNPKEASRSKRSYPGQTSPFPAEPSFRAHDTLEALRHLVDRGGVGLKFGKPEVIKGDRSNYQIGAIVEDTSSFVSLFAKSEFMPNPESVECQCMIRSSSNILHELDPEIDRTLCRLRKVRSTIISNSSSSNSFSNSDNTISGTNDFDFSEYNNSDINYDFNFGVNKSKELEPMENNDQMLKELAMSDVVYQPWCI
ncbi:hypothetical protein CR513_09874, partial [Mucuna pruriens]